MFESHTVEGIEIYAMKVDEGWKESENASRLRLAFWFHFWLALD